MIALGICLMIIGMLCVPFAAGILHFAKKIWLTILLSILACILIVGGALTIGLNQLQHMREMAPSETSVAYVESVESL